MLCGNVRAGSEDTGAHYMAFSLGGMRILVFVMWQFRGRGGRGYGFYCVAASRRWLVRIRGLVMWQFGGVGDEDTGASYVAVLGRAHVAAIWEDEATCYARIRSPLGVGRLFGAKGRAVF